MGRGIEYSGSGGYQSKRIDHIPESNADWRMKKKKKSGSPLGETPIKTFDNSNRDTAHLPNRFSHWRDERLIGKTPQEVSDILARERSQKREPTFLEKLGKLARNDDPTMVELRKQLGY